MEERRSAVRRCAGTLAALALGLAREAGACELPGARLIESPRFALAYRTAPAPRVGEHFAVELRVCPRAVPAPGVPRPIANAHMPEHRHGMNYRPDMVSLGEGRFRSAGWLFHMPGLWEFVFDLGGERLTDSVRIE
jgi:hypothetical protein